MGLTSGVVQWTAKRERFGRHLHPRLFARLTHRGAPRRRLVAGERPVRHLPHRSVRRERPSSPRGTRASGSAAGRESPGRQRQAGPASRRRPASASRESHSRGVVYRPTGRRGVSEPAGLVRGLAALRPRVRRVRPAGPSSRRTLYRFVHRRHRLRDGAHPRRIDVAGGDRLRDGAARRAAADPAGPAVRAGPHPRLHPGADPAHGVPGAHAIDLRGIKWAMLGRVAGTIVAGGILAIVAADTLVLLFGVFILAAVAMSVSGLRFLPTGRALVAAGVLSGVLGTVAAVGGPPLALPLPGRLPAPASGARSRASSWSAPSCRSRRCGSSAASAPASSGWRW